MTQSANADPQIIGREVARAQGLKRFFTGEPCKRGHVAERQCCNRHCVECERERTRNWRAANPEKWREQNRKRRAADPKVRAYYRKYATTPLSQLRVACGHTAVRLELGSLNHSRFKLLDYGPDEFIAHLESTLPNGMTFDDARVADYHVDHIVPMAVISDACPMGKAGRRQAFRMAMDLENLQMIPGADNQGKGAGFDDPEQRGLFDVLCARYL